METPLRIARQAGSVFALLTSLVLPALASAQTPPRNSEAPQVEAGTFRLGTEMTLFDHEELSGNVDIGGAVSFELEDTSTVVGPSQWAGLGALVGYALSEKVVLTARANLYHYDDLGSVGTRVMMIPELEWLLLDTSEEWIPHLGGGVGFRWDSIPVAESDATNVGATFAVRAGVHGFLVQRASIDASVLLFGAVGSMSITTPVPASGLGTGYGAMVTIGTSCWL